MLTPAEWHKRFLTQSRWTEQVRRYLYRDMRLAEMERVLEVGSGTGVITADLQDNSEDGQYKIFGIDLKLENLKLSQVHDRKSLFSCADALRLPFPGGVMDAAVCHFLLLWLKDPLGAIKEMSRVTRKGGVIVALAEPDYSGRIDHPARLGELGRLQAASLKQQGADPEMGRQLSGLFHRAGLQAVQTGLLGGQWNAPPSAWDWESEWAMIESDLAGELSAEELGELVRLDYESWHNGERVLFVPTFYAVGIVG